MERILLAVSAVMFMSTSGMEAQSMVMLGDTGETGKYTVSAAVNGVGVRTFYTDENWFVSMSGTTYLFLYENGYISDDDVRGFTTLKMPDGSSTKAASFVIRNLKVGDRILVKDIPAFVIKKQTVPLLIGSSTFGSLGEVARDGNRIIIGDLEPESSSASVTDPVDSLKLQAQNLLDAQEYSQAAGCFAQLESQGALNMLTQYQYAVLLNMLGKDSDNVRVSNDWLASNEGKSLTMDYWIHNGLGSSHARLGDNASAIASLEKAAAAYGRLFGTSEKSIKKGDFHDQTLGATYYSLGRIYASEGKVSKAESNCALAARCGYQPAIDFCKQYKIKF